METQSEQRRDEYVSTAELMDALSISRSTVNRLVKRGLPHIWVGSVRRFPLTEVVRWLKGRETT
ncbi:MAG: helix-turn-helix domain-containing protein [Deltaproteobacteria bacterium]|nr:helix-turn-helix domain-containing protein [Deltaproteobacteria bacterium]